MRCVFYEITKSHNFTEDDVFSWLPLTKHVVKELTKARRELTKASALLGPRDAAPAEKEDATPMFSIKNPPKK